MALIMRGCWGALMLVLAVVCSTWSAVNLGTSERDLLLPCGASYKPSVRAANKMVSRSGLVDKLFGNLAS